MQFYPAAASSAHPRQQHLRRSHVADGAPIRKRHDILHKFYPTRQDQPPVPVYPSTFNSSFQVLGMMMKHIMPYPALAK